MHVITRGQNNLSLHPEDRAVQEESVGRGVWGGRRKRWTDRKRGEGYRRDVVEGEIAWWEVATVCLNK